MDLNSVQHLIKSLKNADLKHFTFLVACGSFSPVTNMHLRIFEEARIGLEAQGVYVAAGIISPVHYLYDKSSVKVVSSQERLDMCRLATRRSDWITVSSWEIDQSQWTRTLGVLNQYRSDIELFLQEHGRSDIKYSIKLLAGADVLETFTSDVIWDVQDSRKILGEYGMACIEREGIDAGELLDNDPIISPHKRNISMIHSQVVNNISSSRIRALLKENLSIAYLVPDSVVHYIEYKGLYQCMKGSQHLLEE